MSKAIQHTTVKPNNIPQEPGRCVSCDTKIRKEKVQCWFCKKNYPIKKQ